MRPSGGRRDHLALALDDGIESFEAIHDVLAAEQRIEESLELDDTVESWISGSDLSNLSESVVPRREFLVALCGSNKRPPWGRNFPIQVAVKVAQERTIWPHSSRGPATNGRAAVGCDSGMHDGRRIA